MARRTPDPDPSRIRLHTKRPATSAGALRTRHSRALRCARNWTKGCHRPSAGGRETVAHRGPRVVDDPQAGEPGPQAPVGVLVVGEERSGQSAHLGQGLGTEDGGGAAEPEALGRLVEPAVVGCRESVVPGDAVTLEEVPGVIDQRAQRPDLDGLAVHPDGVGQGGVGQPGDRRVPGPTSTARCRDGRRRWRVRSRRRRRRGAPPGPRRPRRSRNEAGDREAGGHRGRTTGRPRGRPRRRARRGPPWGSRPPPSDRRGRRTRCPTTPVRPRRRRSTGRRSRHRHDGVRG